MTGTKNSKVAPKKVEYEFGGPIGTALNTVALPLVVFALYFLCNETGCLQLSDPAKILSNFDLSKVEFWNTTAFLSVFGWFFYQIFLLYALPGAYVKGVKLSTGNQLTYKINGFYCFVVSILSVLAGQYFGIIRLSFIYDKFVAFATSSMILSYLLSFYLYFSSFSGKKLLAHGGNTGNRIYDFWMGRELNPRIGSLDLKCFCELRPGLIGWVVIDYAMAFHQYETYGEISNGIILVCIFQTIYVFDALWSETAILTTMDITTDGFGFMLAFGDLCWVPFTYTTQARYLASQPLFQWDVYVIVLIVLLKVAGMCTFRGANGQKDQFRSNPNHPSVKHIKTIDTQRGTKLMISGWWGIARHINYTGDWLMAWAWCLPCGFSHIVPYFYVIYFGILLVHRDLRDEHSCRQKYGKDWDRYCSIVRYKFIPYVY